MKNYVFLVVLVFITSGFSIANAEKETDKEKAMRSINEFYDAMSSYDYNKMDEYCTTDISIIDNAIYYKTSDEFKALVKTFEGAKMDYKLKVNKSDFHGNSGLIILTFDIDIEMNGEKMHITALENYVMKKEKGKWLIAFIHSSPTNM